MVCFVVTAVITNLAYAQLPAYDSLLKSYVTSKTVRGIDTHWVDYGRWAQDPRHRLAMQQLFNIPVSALEKPAQKAFWINAYNLLTIDLIIQHQEQLSIKNLGTFLTTPWRKHHWVIETRKLNLDSIEHDILRPMGDARIHMAINCASISCPDLRAEAYTAADIDRQLADQLRQFLGNPGKGMRVHTDNLQVSKLFKWFSADFPSQPQTLMAEFYPEQVYKAGIVKPLDYLPYYWDLNGNW